MAETTQKKKTKVQELIESIPTENIPLSQIDYDPDNPNIMSDNQMNSLEKIMKKWHYATECWINKKPKGRFKMIDGEHRCKVLARNHINTIPSKVFQVSEIEAKILRQIANKFRGEHDFEKDAMEFKAIYDAKKMKELSEMMATPVEHFQQILEQQFQIPTQRTEDWNPVSHHEDTFLHGNIKQIMIYFNNADYLKLIPRLQKIMEMENVNNHTDLFLALVKHYEKCPSRKKGN